MENTKGGIPARIGERFHTEIERIKKERLLNNKSKKLISTEKITNVIIRNQFWKEITKDIIKLDEEDLEDLGK